MGALSVAGGSQSEEPPTPLLGAWGGDRVNAVFGVDGARFAYDCAAGSIAGPVRPDSRGRFTASGTHQAYRPGPDRADEAAMARAATYHGHLTGTLLELQVRVDGEATVQRYRLEKDRKVKLVRCL
jgi:hypothetical protein